MTFKSTALALQADAPSRTQNGMKSRASTASKVLDLFGRVGSSRGKALISEFFAAYNENPDLTLRTLQWTRDIRQGAGERQQFRDLLVAFEADSPQEAFRVMHKIPILGRWDDVLVYQNPLNRRAAFQMIKDALAAQDGLCAKWMPRKGPVAVELREFMGLTPKQYRKTLVNLSKTVEQQMCAKQWDEINFSHVPSVASARYQKAFGRNAGTKYAEYLAELQKPVEQRKDKSVKINASAIFPHDIVKTVVKGNAAIANEQWKALPNFVGDARIMPMVDVSGSMGSINGYSHWGSTANGPKPIEVAVALGLYLSEKNTSDFKDMFLTFSARPKLEILKGTLTQRVQQLSRAAWDMNTNLHAAFDEILGVAVQGNVPSEDMPEMLLILSDMQFDSCTRYDDSAMEMIKRKYAKAGYEVPKIVFWNLNSSYGSDSPVRYDEKGTAHISGFAPSIMKSVLANDLEDYTPYNVMLKTLNVERYDLK